LQRSRTQFIGIALAFASHFDDPLGYDLSDYFGLPIVMKAMADPVKRCAHRLGCLVIKRRIVEKRKDVGHWASSRSSPRGDRRSAALPRADLRVDAAAKAGSMAAQWLPNG
jgi:hypothetical protein